MDSIPRISISGYWSRFPLGLCSFANIRKHGIHCTKVSELYPAITTRSDTGKSRRGRWHAKRTWILLYAVGTPCSSINTSAKSIRCPSAEPNNPQPASHRHCPIHTLGRIQDPPNVRHAASHSHLLHRTRELARRRSFARGTHPFFIWKWELHVEPAGCSIACAGAAKVLPDGGSWRKYTAEGTCRAPSNIQWVSGRF